MNKALVLGVTGGFGGHVAEALMANGWQVRALVRDPARLSPRFRNVEIMTGDAGAYEDVSRAAAGTRVIVYGINAPYPQWEGTVVPWLDVTARVAEAQRLTVVFPGNIYNYDPADGPVFDESSPMRPPSRKGELRVAMEARLRLASRHGARVVIVRAGNFIGAHLRGSWLRHLLTHSRRGYALASTGPRDLKHAWIYLPDLAQIVTHLLERADTLPAFDTFHVEGYNASFNDIAATIAQASGEQVVMKPFTWWALKLGAPISPFYRSLLEMRYLWERDMHLDENKLRALLDHAIPRTPFAEALRVAGLIA